MSKYFATYKGMVKTVKATLSTISEDEIHTTYTAQQIVNAINAYKERYLYKCQDTFCPLKRQAIGRLSYAGFASQEALEQHRIKDHKYHGLRNISHSIVGTPWYQCRCGYSAHMNEKELTEFFETDIETEPSSWAEHMRQVDNARA